MKKVISILLTVLMAFGTGAVAFAENQTSVPEGYIGIYTAEDLYNIRNNLSGKYILMNDIDLSVYENWEPIGTWDTPFTGELDGNGYIIKNMTIKGNFNSEGRFLFGLFASSENSVLHNLAVVNATVDVSWNGEEDVSSYCFIGLISGYTDKSETTNCLADGKIKAAGFSTFNVGGIIGVTKNNSKIKYCSNYADLEAISKDNAKNIFMGGICGNFSSSGGSLAVCNYGKIVLYEEIESESSTAYVGGVFGKLAVSFMPASNYYNRGDIQVNSSSKNVSVGGIAGTSSITINSYNTGNIFVSEEFAGYVANITGNFTTSALMPVPGAFDYDRIENAYYLSNGFEAGYCEGKTYDETNENTKDYRFINVNSISNEEMKRQNTFAGFDFEDIWTMEENSYPVFQNQPMVNVKETLELVEGDVYGDIIIANEWSTTNPDVATVNENGEIVAVGAGEATITVTHAYGYTEEIIVAVTGKVEEPTKSFIEKLVDFITALFERILTVIRCIFGFRPML